MGRTSPIHRQREPVCVCSVVLLSSSLFLPLSLNAKRRRQAGRVLSSERVHTSAPCASEKITEGSAESDTTRDPLSTLSIWARARLSVGLREGIFLQALRERFHLQTRERCQFWFLSAMDSGLTMDLGGSLLVLFFHILLIYEHCNDLK